MAIIEAAAAWMARALDPLAFACGAEDEQLAAFVAGLGWELPSVPESLRLVHDDLAQMHETLSELNNLQWKVDVGEATPSELDPIRRALLVDVLAVASGMHALGDRLRAELPPAFVAATRIDEEFETRAFDWLVVTDVAAHSALGYELLRLAGVLELTNEPEDPARHQPAFVRRRVRWERLPTLLRDPGAVAGDVYGWGTHTIDGERLFGALVPLSFALTSPGELHYPEHTFILALAPGVTEPADGPDPQLWVPVLDADEATLYVTALVLPTKTATERQAIALTLVPSGGFDVEIPIGSELAVRVDGAAQIGSGVALVLRPDRDPVVVLDVHDGPAEIAAGRVAAEVVYRAPATDGTTSTGMSGAVRLGAEATSANDAEVFAELHIEQGRITVGVPEGDGLLARLMPADGVVLPFTVTVRWSNRGLSFAGAAGLETAVPLAVSAGPLRLRDLRLSLTASDDGVTARAGVTAGFRLGPVEVAVVGLGVRLTGRLVPGNLGPFDLDVAATAPTGADVAIAAGPVSGGGSLRSDPSTGRYSGTLALRLQQVNVQAVGILDTRLPGGRSGFSLLVLVSARFFPGIQLAFGITLTSVGGLVGVNRRIDVDALRERYASGTAGRLLAAEDPMRDLPALLTELSAVFPPAEGLFVVGPTLQLQWARIVTLDVGVFLEFPGPTRVVVLGTARASVDNPVAAGPLLRLRCDFVGVLDLVKSTLAFDAMLIDSRLLESFPVTGGLMLRAGWGDEPYVLLSVGGFHPDFAPGSLPVPKSLTRLAMSSGSPDDALYLRFEGYFAITPNTVQFGAAVEVSAKLGPLRVRGFIGFDALIRFEPFYFQIDFKAGMRVEWRGRNLAGIAVSGTLSGPGPVKFTGKACIEVLFFDICANASFELGSDAPPAVSTVSSALEVLAIELRNPANLRAVADDRSVTLHSQLVASLPVLPPTGMVWEQAKAPLGLLLDRFQGSPLRRAETVDVTGDAVSGEERDWFAPGSFTELSDAEALTRRSFERLQSGVRIGGGDDHVSAGVVHEVEVEEYRIPAPTPIPPRLQPALEAPFWLEDAVLVREGRSDGPPPAPVIVVGTEQWEVLDLDGRQVATTTEAQAHQLARAARVAVAVPAGDLIALDL